MNRFVLQVFALFFCLSLFGQEYAIEKDIPYRDSKTEKLDPYTQERSVLDIYYPKDAKGYATIFWIHGGGLQSGNKYFPEELLNQGMAVVAINYRLYPKAKAPACIDDAAAALAWVFSNIEKYGGDPGKIFVTGHSAGGYLVSMIGLDKKYLKKYGVDADDVSAYLPLSGQTITHSTIRSDKGFSRTQPIIDQYAPVHHVRADAPPFIFITGGRDKDIPARYEENVYMKRLMEQAGHKKSILYELDGFDHGTMVSPGCQLVLSHIRELLKESKE